MSNWYWNDGGSKRGPISSAELKQLAARGQILPHTNVWREGHEQAVNAGRIQGLFTVPPVPPHSDTNARSTPPPPENGEAPLEAAQPTRIRAQQVLSDVRSVNFRTEVVPIDGSNLPQILTDYAFWGVAVLAIGPQLIATLKASDPLATQHLQLTAFALLFAGLWGVIFKYFMLKSASGWLAPSAALLGTGMLGIPLLLWLHSTLFPQWYLELPHSKNPLLSFCGSVLQTGTWEEFIKSLPVLIYLYWPRKQVNPATALAVGMFSGLGFAAFENVGYALRPAFGIANLAEEFSALSAEAKNWVREDARSAMLQEVAQAQIGVLMRSLSDVFGHAILSGIVAYFAIMGRITGRRRIALYVIGWSVAAFLHGAYNWSGQWSPIIMPAIDGFAFVLLYAYWIKLRALTAPESSAQLSNAAHVAASPAG